MKQTFKQRTCMRIHAPTLIQGEGLALIHFYSRILVLTYDLMGRIHDFFNILLR